MQIPRSQGRDTAKPTLQQHTPMTGLSSLGNVIGGAVQARDDKLREQEAQSKMIGLYHDQIAEQEAKVKLDDVMTTQMNEQVTLVKNELANGTINATKANENLKAWSDTRYKELENDMPMHAREKLKGYWDDNINRQSSSFLPLQLRADAQKGTLIADQAFDISTRQDRVAGRAYLVKNLESLNLSVADKAERLAKYDTTRDLMTIDQRVTSAVEAENTDDLKTLLGEVRGGSFTYVDGPTIQNKEKEILSRIGALDKQAEVKENKRLQVSGKVFNDYKSQVLTGMALDSDYTANIEQAVKGTEHEAEFQFYKNQSQNFQNFSRKSSSEMLSLINQQKASMKNSSSSDPVTGEKILAVYEGMYNEKLKTIKDNPNQAVQEAGLKPNQLTGMELKSNAASFATKAIENGINQFALKDNNVSLKPISNEDLPDAKKAFDEMGVNGKLDFIGHLISQASHVPNGAKIWGATLGQLGGSDTAYIMAGAARANGFRSNTGEDVATAIISGTQALKNKQLIMPKDDLLRSEFNNYVGKSVIGVTSDLNFAAFKAIYAHLSERDGYQHKDKDELNKSLAKTALSLTTGGVYSQDIKYGNQKTWKVSKPYGMQDEAFESTVSAGLRHISSQTNIPIAELENFRLSRSDNRSAKGEIQYDLVNERGNPLIVGKTIWRVQMPGRTK
ncbi:methyl-coenzyme M reductase [Acinetobacter sp. TY2]|uniref:methyl-coenzyme M reductase n=1 Tax=Acinetobacter sp. TY2 TaxID=3387403 RepID=UPI0039176FFC